MLHPVGSVDLPPHAKPGGFDHAAVHRRTGRVYVAHTANDAVDVLDGPAGRYVESIAGLPGVAGALVSDERELVFTSNRAENTVGVFAIATPHDVRKAAVGLGPNGLAYDPRRHRVLSAHVGNPAVAASFTVALVDAASVTVVRDLAVAGRTRWTVYDPVADAFHVNVMAPPIVATISAETLTLERAVTMPSAGPHGLDLDVMARRLYCACDGGQLVELDADDGKVLRSAPLAGVPDVIFLNARLGRLYVAVGDPGVLEVFDTRSLERVQAVTTEPGAHTFAFDPDRDLVYALLPGTHRAAVYVDRE